MAHAIQLTPTHRGVGLTSFIIGLFHAFQRCGIKVTYYKPIAQLNDNGDSSYDALTLLSAMNQPQPSSPISADQADQWLSSGQSDQLLEAILIEYDKLAKDNQVIIVGGLLETNQQPYANELNHMMAKAIGADIILATDALNVDRAYFEHRLSFAAAAYGGTHGERLLGAVVNRVGDESSLSEDVIQNSQLFNDRFQLIATIPFNAKLTYPRTLDVVNFLSGQVIHAGEMETRRIAQYALIARTIPNAIEFLRAGRLVITPSDRDDVIMAAALAAASGHQIAGILLTGDSDITEQILALCMPLFEASGLPVIRVPTGSWQLAKQMDSFNQHAPADDTVRVQRMMEHFANEINDTWCQQYTDRKVQLRLSPAAFKYRMVKQAQSAAKTIVLPEGEEPRTVVAANICAERQIAQCLLLGNPEKIQSIAVNQGITLHKNIQMIDPDSIRSDYIAPLIAQRKHKGMNETLAKAQLEDNVMLGTMMLAAKEVDGLVSGAIHTTANTIRPALQIIKTAPSTQLISSIFFMCLPDQVLVYGDCAINPNPNAEQLAEIAIQSADSATAFGILPKVAMVSYSTGNSGSGEEVEKVRSATDMVRQRRPDIIIDGPLQYDAAAIASVARKKAPDSPVAGQANVFIFPDLNTGNTTYKAVQRSANAISIGPMLQGMRMPVNDLSRGALIEDIVYTIAITAIQAMPKTTE